MSKDDAGPETAPDLWGTERPLDPTFTPVRELISEEITNNERRRFADSRKVPNYLMGHRDEILRHTRESFVGVYGTLGRDATQAFYFPHVGEVKGVQAAWEPWIANSDVLLRYYDERDWSPETAHTILSGVIKAVHGRKVVPDYDKPGLSVDEMDEEEREEWFGEQIDLEDQIS